MLNTSPCTTCHTKSSFCGSSLMAYLCSPLVQPNYSATTMLPLTFQKTTYGTPTPNTSEWSIISLMNAYLQATSRYLALALRTTPQIYLRNRLPMLTSTTSATTSVYGALALTEEENYHMFIFALWLSFLGSWSLSWFLFFIPTPYILGYPLLGLWLIFTIYNNPILYFWLVYHRVSVKEECRNEVIGQASGQWTHMIKYYICVEISECLSLVIYYPLWLRIFRYL